MFPIISFVVSGGRNPAALYDYAYYDLRPRISRIPDVSNVTVQGGDVREILVAADPPALISAGLSISDVTDRIGKEHRLKAVGRMDRETLQYQVLTNSVAEKPPDIENIVVAEKNGQLIRVRDVAKVTVSHADRTMAIRANGRDAVALTVFRRLGGDALTVSDKLKDVLTDAAASAPKGIEIVPIYDQATLVRASIANVRDAIIIGAVFSVLILLAFLRSWRATIIASSAIPLTLVISFAFLRQLGDTLNLMSLGGLAVAIGLIIDDTVVVIENIARRLAQGESGDVAVDRGSKEISGSRDRLDVYLDPGVPAAGFCAWCYRPILPIVEPCAHRGIVGIDGRQFDHHPRAGGTLSRRAQNASERTALQPFGGIL